MTEVRPARDAGEVAAAMALRRAVFCDEQGVSLADELDGRDAEALHLVVVQDGAVVATCRLLADGAKVKLARMAVARSTRGRGLAGALLAEAERRAPALGAQRIALDAQLGARAIYERGGYRACGDVFLDAGIEHIAMVKDLRAAPADR
jgi:predicted GNAT family N-acyltransferase